MQPGMLRTARVYPTKLSQKQKNRTTVSQQQARLPNLSSESQPISNLNPLKVHTPNPFSLNYSTKKQQGSPTPSPKSLQIRFSQNLSSHPALFFIAKRVFPIPHLHHET